MRLLVARDVQDVAKALGRDQADLGSLVLKRDVGRHGGAVQHQVNRLETHTGLAANGVHARHHRARRVVRRGRHLVDRDRACRLVDQNQVRERAADIYADAPHGSPPASAHSPHGRGETLTLRRRACEGPVSAPSGAGIASSSPTPGRKTIAMRAGRRRGGRGDVCASGMNRCLVTGRCGRYLTVVGRLQASRALPIAEHRYDVP